MALARKVLKQIQMGNNKKLIIQLTLSGSYVQTTGEPCDITAANIPNPNGLAVTGPNELPRIPPKIGASQLGGYKAEFTPGSTAANGFLTFWTSGGTELAAAPYPASISGGTLTLEVDF